MSVSFIATKIIRFYQNASDIKKPQHLV